MPQKLQILQILPYLFRQLHKSVLFGQKWRISAPRIVINNPKIIDLLSYKFYGGIVNYNPRRTYCPLVPKQYTFNATKGSPQNITLFNFYYSSRHEHDGRGRSGDRRNQQPQNNRHSRIEMQPIR